MQSRQRLRRLPVFSLPPHPPAAASKRANSIHLPRRGAQIVRHTRERRNRRAAHHDRPLRARTVCSGRTRAQPSEDARRSHARLQTRFWVGASVNGQWIISRTSMDHQFLVDFSIWLAEAWEFVNA
eukprot:328321-Pleurochrysis_carterae.AAC.1